MSLLNRQRKQKHHKEIFENFTPEEMKVIGSFMFNRQKLPKSQRDMVTTMNRPYPIYDRFMLAIRSIWEAFQKKTGNPNKSPFRACVFLPHLSKIQETADLTEKEMVESRKLYATLMKWDTKEIAKWAKEIGDKVNMGFGFTETHEAVPFSDDEITSGNSIEDLASSDAPEPPAEDKDPGDDKGEEVDPKDDGGDKGNKSKKKK